MDKYEHPGFLNSENYYQVRIRLSSNSRWMVYSDKVPTYDSALAIKKRILRKNSTIEVFIAEVEIKYFAADLFGTIYGG